MLHRRVGPALEVPVRTLVDAILAMDGAAALRALADDPGAAAARGPAGASVLLLARYRGMAAVVDAVVAAGADLDARQRGGFAPLHEVALRGDAGLAELLLGAGADPAPVDDEGRTAADRAAERGHDDLARHLTGAATARTPPPA